MTRFFAWSAARGLEFAQISPIAVATYIEEMQSMYRAPTITAGDLRCRSQCELHLALCQLGIKPGTDKALEGDAHDDNRDSLTPCLRTRLRASCAWSGALGLTGGLNKASAVVPVPPAGARAPLG